MVRLVEVKQFSKLSDSSVPPGESSLSLPAFDSEFGQNLLLRGKCICVTHCDNNLLQVGAGGDARPADT